jgi:hypothetical protein
MIPCVSHEEEKRGAVNTRTEYNALFSAVIRCGDGSETFLACSVLQYEHVVQRKASQRLSFPTGGGKHSDAPIYSSLPSASEPSAYVPDIVVFLQRTPVLTSSQ